MAKLTLSVDPTVVAAAKRYAAAAGTSVSQLVENYLSALVQAPQEVGEPPMLARWRGTMAAEDDQALEDYRDHLVEKYR